MGVRYCCVQGCNSNVKAHPNLIFFRLPKELERLAIWIEKTKRHDLESKDRLFAYRNCRICSKHFGKSMLKKNRGGKVSLVPNAVPTIFIGSSASSLCSPSLNGTSVLPSNRNYISSKTSSAQIIVSSNLDEENKPPNSQNISHNSLPSPRNAASTPCTSRVQTSGVSKRAKKKLPLDSSSAEGQLLDPDSDPESFLPPFLSTIHRGFVSGVYNFNRKRKLSFNRIDSAQALEDSPQDSSVCHNTDHSYSRGDVSPASKTFEDSSMQTQKTATGATTNSFFLDHSYSKGEVLPETDSIKGSATQTSQTTTEDSSSFCFPPATNTITDCAMPTLQTTTQDSSSFCFPPLIENCSTDCINNGNESADIISMDTSIPCLDSINSVAEVTLGSKASADCATQAEPFLSSNTPRKAKLRRRTKSLKAKIKKSESEDQKINGEG